MPVITDEEFGKIIVRRSARASQVRIRVAPDGRLRASLPMYAPMFLVKRLLKNSREQLREILQAEHPTIEYENGMQIGKSHTLIIREVETSSLKVNTRRQQIIVDLPAHSSASDPAHQQEIRDAIAKALRREAKSYLPRRLKFLAEEHGYHYSNVRFSHASSRWGSCSSNGTISLNIALMKLPFELIDYVLVHELSHTREMNHSDDFWSLVGAADPNYKSHRQQLKNHSTSI